MKIYNKKYLFIGILSALVTACGSGGGGGGSSSNSPSASTPSPTVSSKPTTNIVAPVNPEKAEGKPMIPVIPEVNKPNGGDNGDNPNLPVVEENEEIVPLPPFEVPPSKNSSVLEVKEIGGTGLVAFDDITAINEKSGTINISADESIGMVAFDKKSKAINNGNIIANIENSKAGVILMKALDGAALENNGKLKGDGTIITGMHSSSKGEGFTSINNGEIKINGNRKTEAEYGSLTGMKAVKLVKDGVPEGEIYILNKGKITVNNNDFELLNPKKPFTIEGMSIVAFDSKTKNTIENTGTISVSGRNAVGMESYGENTFAINRGTINVDGELAIGMNSLSGSVATNEKEGVINVKGINSYGMVARLGGKVINKGKIILGGDSPIKTGIFADHEGSSVINEGEIIFQNDGTGSRGIVTIGGATYVNKGKILANENLEITGDKLSEFIVGKEASGDVSRVRAKRSLKIDGDVVASKDLIDGNKKEVIYKDVFSAPKIELARGTDSKAVSMFYNSKLELNKTENVDMVVYRNETTIEESYESTEFNSLTSSLDNFLDIEGMELSKDEKLVVDKILKSDNINEVQKVVKDLSGEIYANLPRQIFDIQDRFIKEDGKLIDNLNEYSYNFNFFGDKSSVKNKGEISGYKTTSEGFVGTKRFENNIYATIGYENSSVKYNEGSKGSIQSIHTGIYKKLLLNEFDIKLGLNGEYNFHETNREIDSFDKKAKGKYNSYTLGANSEISRVYGDSLYIKPTLGLNLGYGKYEKFTEKNAGDLGLTVKEESYFSVLPSVGFKVGKNFESVDIYSNAIYSYELGDLNKKQGMSLLGDKVNYKLNSDSLEKANLVLNAGVSTEIKDFKITFELGKEFGKRDNNYLALGIGYKF
ncbi:MAG: autotransporter outer membrane beta-barrel domain-containing protein [Cetobacterium sp.]